MALETLPSAVHRLSLDEYQRLVRSGVFAGARIELIDGVLVDMSPKSPEHENVIAWLARWAIAGTVPERVQVRVAAPLTIARSEPEPDVTVVERGTPTPNHPASAALVIEVAVSSQHRDLVEKPPIYAEAGVPVYWVVDLDAGRAVVHANPRDGRYCEVRELGPDGTLVAPPGLGLPPIALAELLAAAPSP